MLPRLEFLFSRGPPSARSPQIRPHSVTVSHLSSVSFRLLPLSLLACSLIRKSGTFRLPRLDNNDSSLSKMAEHGPLCLFAFSRPGSSAALPNRIGLPWPNPPRRRVSRTPSLAESIFFRPRARTVQGTCTRERAVTCFEAYRMLAPRVLFATLLSSWSMVASRRSLLSPSLARSNLNQPHE